MTVRGPWEHPNVKYFMCLAADTKPTLALHPGLNPGDRLFETDTQTWYIYGDAVWTVFVAAGTLGAMTAATDPASSVATTAAIIDAYVGTVITLNGAGNAQTLATPTIATAGKVFTVVNNDTSTNDQDVVANTVTFTITPGEAQSFIWDGTAWGPTSMGIISIPVTVLQGGTGRTTIAAYRDDLTLLGATEKVYIDGRTTAHTDPDGILSVVQTTASNANKCIYTSLIDTATVGHILYGQYTEVASFAVVTEAAQTLYGEYTSVIKSGVDTSVATTTLYGGYFAASNTGSSAAGAKNTYGLFASAVGDAAGTTVTYGLYATATGADTNWAAYLIGNVLIEGNLSSGSEENVMTATDTWTTQECRGTLISNLGQGAAATYTLPTAAEGLNFTFTCAVTEDVHIKAGASDLIYLDGTALDDADKVSNTAAAISHNITFWTIETSAGVYDWLAASGPGPWVDGGA